MMRMAAFLLSLIIVFSSLPAHADKDKGLYDPRPPAGSSFVRFFNAANKPIAPSIGGKSYGEIPAAAASAYYVQKQGSVNFSAGLKVLPLTLEADAFYTVITDDDGTPYLHKDTVSDDPAKAMLVLYNISSPTALALRAKDGMVTVVDNVGKGKSAYRGINAVKVDLNVTGEGEKIVHRFEPFILEQGRTYSIFFVNGKTVMVKGETDTTR